MSASADAQKGMAFPVPDVDQPVAESQRFPSLEEKLRRHSQRMERELAYAEARLHELEIRLHTRSGEWDVTPPKLVDFPPSNPFSSYYQPSNPFNPFFPPLTSTPDNACAHLEDKVEDDAKPPQHDLCACRYVECQPSSTC